MQFIQQICIIFVVCLFVIGATTTIKTIQKSSKEALNQETIENVKDNSKTDESSSSTSENEDDYKVEDHKNEDNESDGNFFSRVGKKIGNIFESLPASKMNFVFGLPHAVMKFFSTASASFFHFVNKMMHKLFLITGPFAKSMMKPILVPI